MDGGAGPGQGLGDKADPGGPGRDARGRAVTQPWWRLGTGAVQLPVTEPQVWRRSPHEEGAKNEENPQGNSKSLQCGLRNCHGSLREHRKPERRAGGRNGVRGCQRQKLRRAWLGRWVLPGRAVWVASVHRAPGEDRDETRSQSGDHRSRGPRDSRAVAAGLTCGRRLPPRHPPTLCLSLSFPAGLRLPPPASGPTSVLLPS